MYDELQQKVNKVFWGNISKLKGHVCFNFCVDVARRATLVLRLRTANLL